LLNRCRSGDVNAWHTLVRRYERLIFSVATRNGLIQEDAADVTQTTLVELLKSIHQLRDDSSLTSWLMTVARRQSWRLKQEQTRQAVQPAEPTAPADTIGDWERATAVHDALRRLPMPCRALLYALYLDPTEPSYDDIAHRMGRATGTIGPLRARCLAHLQAALADH
jgi:RNA polymerase sigma factor (sigma-70 family)